MPRPSATQPSLRRHHSRVHRPRLITGCILALATAVGFAALPAEASPARTFVVDSREAALAGDVERVSIDARGALTLSRAIEHVAGIDEPFVFAADAVPVRRGGGWLLGTGSSGKVVRVAGDGVVEVLATLEAPEVYAVLGAASGLYAAGSPDGAVVRLDPEGSEDASGEVIFDPEATYVWGLAETADGDLLVATGLPARLWRVDPEGERDAELLFESNDAHLRALAVLPDGDVLVGTAGQGLVQRLDLESGSGTVAASTLYDAAQPEIAAFAVGPQGEIFAAALASEASFVDLSQNNGAQGGEAEADASAPQNPTIGSRAGGAQGPRALVVRLPPDGGMPEDVASFADETIHSLLWHDDALWIGTGQEGRLYRWMHDPLIGADGQGGVGQVLREAELEGRQIVGLVRGDDGVGIVTTNGAALHRLDDGPSTDGTYTSDRLDAAQVARFGALRWRGLLPRGAAVRAAVRSGTSAEPDATWTPWTDVQLDLQPGDAAGGLVTAEAPLAALPNGRYLQWRLHLERGGSDAGPRVDAVELTYRQRNLPPRVTSFEALDPGAILVEQSFNPSSTTFEPWSPNRDGIFDTLRKEQTTDEARLKTLYKKGWRTLRWDADDANGDTLQYRLEVAPLAASGIVAVDGVRWLPVVDGLDRTWFSFDSTALPDGLYRFRLQASDGASQPLGDARTAVQLSEPVLLDHTPPRVGLNQREGERLIVVIQDERSPIREVELSVDAGPWRSVPAADGLLDSRRENLELDVPSDASVAILRATDAAFNVLTFTLEAP
ncbi:MAG: hypothetical protein AAGC60_23895 [Acidobacteriota bacterium]